MKNFFKIIFGSCLGVILASVAVMLFGSLLVAGIAAGADKKKPVKENTVLHLEFDEAVPEQTDNTEVNFAELSLSGDKTLGLHDIIRTINYAKQDDRVKGIYLEFMSIPTSGASSTLIREALDDFRADGKFVLAYSKYYTQGAYYMASVADKVYLNPLGGVDFRGYGAVMSFFKEMLDELGVKMEVFKVGKFKGAVEPFTRNELSEENRHQIRQYMEGLWTEAKKDIGKSRNKTSAELQAIADSYGTANAEGALANGLVDAIAYQDEAMTEIRTRLGLDADKKISFITIGDYYPSVKKEKEGSFKNKVAVVIAEGGIVDGEGKNGEIGDKKYVEVIRKLRYDKKVKAIVLRVNSGGGSAMASENIWRELKLCKEAGKPVVTSMSDVAASGGYYIACASDSIFAEPNTITGSIGVFGLFPITKDLLNDKLHINFDSVKTAKFAASFLPTQDMTEEEKAIMQNSTEQIYEIFIKRVADARGMTTDAVKEIAQGRVWTGVKAQEIGLVDRFGGLDDAIEAAASLAEITDYRTSEYPKQKDALTKMIEELTGEKTSIKESVIKAELGEYYQYYHQLKEWQNMKGVQARMPFEIVIQ